MRKILLSMAVLLAVAAPVHEASAVVPMCPIVVGASGSGAVIGIGTTLLPGALFALAAMNVDPWTPVFGKEHVFYEYPTGANHVYVQPQKVNYVPLAQKVVRKPYHIVSQYGTDSIRSD